MIIYTLKNMITGCLYVGQTISLPQRLRQHKHLARKGSTLRLYRAINKYGWENFKVIRKFDCPEYLVDDFETSLIKSLREDIGERSVYNISDGGQAHKRHSKETRELMSRIAKEKGQKPQNILHHKRPVIAYNAETMEFVGWYDGIVRVIKDLGAENINRVLRGVSKQSNGYTFRYDMGGVPSL